MIRNWLKMLLCLLLVLMLPLYALADVQHTLQILPGSGAGADDAAADLLEVLSLKLTCGEKSGAVTVALEDTDIATAAFTADATGVYVHSNLLSDDVLYVTWDDGFAYLTELLKARMAAEGVPESETAELENSMAQFKNAIVKAAGSSVPAGTGAALEVNAEAAAQMLHDDPEMLTFAEMLYEKLTVEDGTFADEARDTADQKYSLVLNSEDMLKLCDSEYMRTLTTEVVVAMQSDGQGETLEKTVDELLEQARETYRSSDCELVMTMYTQSGGTVLVGMEMNVSMKGKEESAAGSLGLSLNYGCLSDENGVTYRADMAASADGADALQMAFELHRGVNEVSEGRLAMLADGEEITLMYRAENTQPNVRERGVDLYLRSGASAIIEPAFSDRPVLSCRITTSPADPSVLAAVEQAEPDRSVNVMKLSDEEMQALGSEISTRCMQVLYAALAKLPTSALQLAMRLMQ